MDIDDFHDLAFIQLFLLLRPFGPNSRSKQTPKTPRSGIESVAQHNSVFCQTVAADLQLVAVVDKRASSLTCVIYAT